MNGDNFNGNVDNGQQQYNQSQYGGAGNSDDKTMAIASMVLGILSIVLVCLMFASTILSYIGIVCAIVAIVLGALSKKKIGKNGMATAGLVCGIVAISFFVFIWLLAIIGLAALMGTVM
ncbi:MAG: DUF4190 domain-containing protein [Lachnospiraceae bacterium]|nr:DUF4190 domain-containing protein [Lachnospiraceae bacterium]